MSIVVYDNSDTTSKYKWWVFAYTPNFENFICTIDIIYIGEKCLDENGKIDYDKLKPVLFEFPTYQYMKAGETLGKCLSFK